MIPKIIHYCWFGGNPIPEDAKKCIESWKKYCPDYEIKEWNESNFDVTKNKYMYQAYRAKKWGFVPDYARLDIIYNYGGIYLDTDVEIIKPLDELLNQKGFCGIENGSLCIALGLGFGAEKNDKTIKLLLDSYEKLFFIKNGQPDLTPAPILNEKILKNLYIKNENIITHCGTLTVYPTEYFCPMNYDTGEIKITEKTYSIHHYTASWYDKSNLYALELKRKFIKYLPRKIAVILATTISKLKYNGFRECINWILKKR